MKTFIDNIKSVVLFLLMLLIYTGGVIYLYHRHELKNAKTVVVQVPVVIQPVIAPKHEVHAASKSKPDSSTVWIVGNLFGLMSDSLETLTVRNDSLRTLFAANFYPRWTVFTDTTVCGDSLYSFYMIQQNEVGFKFFPDSISKDLIYKKFKLTLNMENITKTIPPNYGFWDWLEYPVTEVILVGTVAAILLKAL